MDAIELLTTTKGVRKRIDFDRPVPYALLEECVEIAVKAPLGGEEWQPHFLVIDENPGEFFHQQADLANFVSDGSAELGGLFFENVHT